MKTLIALVVSLVAVTAWAIVPNRLQRDLRLPTQVLMHRQTITTPIDATTNYIKTTYAGPTSGAAVTLSSFSHQPDVPRNLTITPTGTTADVESCAIVVTGTNILNQSISETFTFAANDSTAQTGSKAFKTVTSIYWPASCESGGYAATWIVGVGAKLGLDRCMESAGMVFHASFDGAAESLGTVAASASAVGSNTYTPSGTMNGAKNVDVFFAENFACY